MAMNSIITNIGAQVALQSLNKTQDELAVTQKRISTGLRVADSRDDGAAFAVAERVRGEMAATTSANEQLGGAKGLLDVTRSSLENVSTSLNKLKEIVVKLAGDLTTEQRTQYQTQAKELTNNVKAFITDANYNPSGAPAASASTSQLVAGKWKKRTSIGHGAPAWKRGQNSNSSRQWGHARSMKTAAIRRGCWPGMASGLSGT